LGLKGDITLTTINMTNILNEALASLLEGFHAQPCDLCGDSGLMIDREHLVEAAQLLRDKYGFDMLADITASDYWPQIIPRFHVVYNFSSLKHTLRLYLRVPLNDDDPHIPTIEGVYPCANWFEREIWDMFGILIDGHSDLRRLLMPRDWQGHPLRKDFPLGYEEPQFTFNYDDIDRRKVHSIKGEE
jgi:NADH-quinone oxidoreductase subunit C